MITPRFSLSQDDKTLTIQIRAPYCSLRELEVEVDENVFLFFCKPYFLRLYLPGNLIEDNYKSSFDCDSGEFTFTYNKALCGEHFKDLDYITKFLVNKAETSYESCNKQILIIDNEAKLAGDEELTQGFGFALLGHKNFVTISSEFNEVFDINPNEVNLKDRKKLRLKYEQGKFDMGHYLADYIENEEIVSLMEENTPWDGIEDKDINFTNKELDFLKNLPNIEYKLSDIQINYVFNSLIDILFAYCYDGRTTCYDANPESGWTIAKLSASLCWLDVFETPKEALISACRRSVIYPLYRNFDLTLKILTDLKNVLSLSEKYIIKCLIEIYYIFLGGDCCRYILNNLFIKDYIIYIMNWDRNKWREYVKVVNLIKIDKSELGLNLSEVENGFVLENKFENLKITEADSDDSDDDCTATDSSDENTSSTDSETDSSNSDSDKKLVDNEL